VFWLTAALGVPALMALRMIARGTVVQAAASEQQQAEVRLAGLTHPSIIKTTFLLYFAGRLV
jgi:hypothetical protein